MVGLHQILAGRIECYYMLGTTTKLSMQFQVLKEIFFLGSGLTVTEINIKKVQKQDLKNIKNVGMACQKACKQGRDDIIVKVNLQSPIPTSLYM